MNLTQDFIHGSTKKSLAAMVLPLLIAIVLNMAYNLVDSLWIGNLLGETAYAALTNATRSSSYSTPSLWVLPMASPFCSHRRWALAIAFAARA